VTDQTTPTTVSTLADHVAVTDAVVEQLAAHAVRLHHGDGQYSDVPRYVADEIGQAVLALVPAALTPAQYALLDAVKDVASAPEAPAATYATEQLARLASEAFGYPLPPPVVREGGVAGFLFGRPVTPPPQQPAGTAPIDLAARRARATGSVVVPATSYPIGEHPVGPADPEPDGWPFKPGDVVHDSGEDADDAAWLEAAPEDTVVVDYQGTECTRRRAGWSNGTLGGTVTSVELADLGPITVVSVPDMDEACTPDRDA